MAVLLSFSCACAGQAQMVVPQRVSSGDLSKAPYASTGFVSTAIGGEYFRGSGSVVQNASLLYTCAHVIYNKGIWADAVVFHRALHSGFEPSDVDGVVARGFSYVSGYADAPFFPYDFDRDFAVAYVLSPQVFGVPLSWYPAESGAATGAITNEVAEKLIVGYPAELDYNRAEGFYYQHSTGPFKGAFRQLSGAWYEIDGVSTGGGNSGGPVLVKDSLGYGLAGVLVSADTETFAAGIYVLDESAELAAKQALDSAKDSAPTALLNYSAQANRPRKLKDGRIKFTKVTMRVPKRRVLPFTTEVRLDLNVAAEYRGDLDIFLRSPRGRTFSIAAANPENNAGSLFVSNKDVSGPFIGYDPTGRWQLFLRDYYRGYASRFQGARLQISSR
jgi:subtilisin-like proprotein convertase family protein